MTTEAKSLTAYTVEIVAAQIGCNPIAPSELPGLIRTVHDTLAGLDDQQAADSRYAKPSTGTAPVPAVPVEVSVRPDYIVCLEDGKQLKMLKRYLGTRYGLTPEAYRAKWGLPRDYPMIAPNGSKRRSAIAKKSRLGNTQHNR